MLGLFNRSDRQDADSKEAVNYRQNFRLRMEDKLRLKESASDNDL